MAQILEQEIRLCVLAGYNVRNLMPVDAYFLSSHIMSDRELSERARACRVPASQGTRERVAAVNAMPEEQRFATMTEAESHQFWNDLIELHEHPDYNKALASLSKGELAALRARIAAK